jgi:hypothetical protein
LISAISVEQCMCLPILSSKTETWQVFEGPHPIRKIRRWTNTQNNYRSLEKTCIEPGL